MAFDFQQFANDLSADETLRTEFRDDPRGVLSRYGLTITDEAADRIREVNSAAQVIPDLTVIASPITET